MLFEQVQRVILAKKIFWGQVHFKQEFKKKKAGKNMKKAAT